MKVYIARTTSVMLLDGPLENVLGVFSTKEKALNALKTELDFDKAKKTSDDSYVYHFDGELSLYFTVEELELDEKIGFSL